MNSRLSFAAFVGQLQSELPAFGAAVESRLQSALRGMLAARSGGAGLRGDQAEAAAFLQARPQRLARVYADCLQRRVAEEMADPLADVGIGVGAAGARGLAEPSAAWSGMPAAAAPPLALSLMDEHEVEQGIEQVRMERQIEQTVEWSLRELRSLCAALPGRSRVDLIDAYPLTPALAAEALASALAEIELPPPLRLTVLRAAGSGLGSELAALYDTHLARLRSAGIEPAPLRIKPSSPTIPSQPSADSRADGTSGVAPGAGAGRGAGLDLGAELAAETHRAIARLFAAGAAGLDMGALAPRPLASAPGLPALNAQTSSGLPVTTGEQLAQLLQILSRQSQSGPAMQAVWQRLLDPLQRMGATELNQLQQTDHPFWRLLDRIAVLSSVQAQSGPAMSELAARLEPVMAELERSSNLTVEQFDTALAELDTLPAADLPAPSQAMESVLDVEARRREIEPAVRSQLVWQLRPLGLPDVLNQFLLGPWVQVLTHALASAGPESPQTMRFMNNVADLLAAVSQQRRGQPVQADVRQPLLDVAEEGMRASGLPQHQVLGCLNDLAAVLAGAAAGGPTTAAASAAATSAAAGGGPMAAAPDLTSAIADPLPATAEGPAGPDSGFSDSGLSEWLGHAELDTVQMPFGVETEAGQASSRAWVDGLRVGGLCRLMLQGRWVTAMLSWRSDNGLFYMFKSRHAAGTHTLTQRALERMRSEGLATTIEPGQLLARALKAMSGPG